MGFPQINDEAFLLLVFLCLAGGFVSNFGLRIPLLGRLGQPIVAIHKMYRPINNYLSEFIMWPSNNIDLSWWVFDNGVMFVFVCGPRLIFSLFLSRELSQNIIIGAQTFL